jgi:hypothetical protein
MMENVMNEFKSWEEMSELEQAQCTYWDMYKDAYGVRPRGIDTSAWTVEDFDREFAELGGIIDREEEDRKEREAEASVRFENQITSLVQSGARDRQAAIAWIHEAEGTNGDDDYLAWTLGLPYQYFRKVA